MPLQVSGFGARETGGHGLTGRRRITMGTTVGPSTGDSDRSRAAAPEGGGGRADRTAFWDLTDHGGALWAMEASGADGLPCRAPSGRRHQVCSGPEAASMLTHARGPE